MVIQAIRKGFPSFLKRLHQKAVMKEDIVEEDINQAIDELEGRVRLLKDECNNIINEMIFIKKVIDEKGK